MGFWGTLGKIGKGVLNVASVVPSPIQPFALAGNALTRLPGALKSGDPGQIAQDVTSAGATLSGGQRSYGNGSRYHFLNAIRQQGVNVPDIGGQGATSAALAQQGGGGNGFLDSLKDFVFSKKGAAAGAALAGLYDQRKRRQQSERSSQQRLDALVAALGRTEQQDRANDPMRKASLAHMLQGLQDPGFLTQQLR